MTSTLPGGLRRPLITTSKVLVSAGLLAWLLHKAGFGSLADAIRHASLIWLGTGVALGFLSTCVQAWQWQALLGALDMPRRWLVCLRLIFAGNSVNVILPTSIGGDVMRANMVARGPRERVGGLTSVVLQRLCNFPGMILIMGVGLLFTLSSHQADRVRPLAAMGVLVGITGLVLCVTPMFAWLARQRTLERVRIAKLFLALDDFRGQSRQLLHASARGTVFWTLAVLNQWCFMRAVGINADLLYAAMVTTTVNAITLLPISINGYGLRDTGFVALLTVQGLASTSAALTASLCLTAQSFLWALVGLPFLLIGSRASARAAKRTALTELA
jgi:glycosyltransferase 2 family protein